MNLEVVYSKIGGRVGLQQGLAPPSSAAKFAPQGDAYVRTDTQIIFLYYALLLYMFSCLNNEFVTCMSLLWFKLTENNQTGPLDYRV